MSTTKVRNSFHLSCIILDGAISRDACTITEKAFKEQQKGKPPMLPLWLLTTQVRLIPLSEEFLVKWRDSWWNRKMYIRVDVDAAQALFRSEFAKAENWLGPLCCSRRKAWGESGMLSIRTGRLVERWRTWGLNELINQIQRRNQRTFKPLPFA